MSSLIRINRDRDDSRRAWLVGHPAMDVRTWTHLQGERRTVSRLQQQDSGVEWKNKSFADKKNQSVEQSGSGVRNFASELAAFRFKNSLSAQAPDDQPHPWAGDVVVRLTTGGDTFEEVMLPEAVVALDPILGGGASLQLGYNIKAGYVQSHRAGQIKQLTAQAASGLPATMYFFGDKVGGELTDTVAATTDIVSSGWTIPSGYYIQFDLYPYAAATPVSYKYTVGVSALLHTQLTYPLSLAQLAATIGTGDYISAELTTRQGRQCVKFSITDAAAPFVDGLAGSRLQVRIRGSSSLTTLLKYDASTYGNAVQEQRLTIGGKPLLVDVAA
jgi:hypothetical protein